MKIRDLVDKTVCISSTEDCYHQRCDNCGDINVSDLFIVEDDIEEALDTNWSLWVVTNNRVELQHFSGSFSSLINQLNARWAAFVTHTYVTRQQREYIKRIKLTSSFTTFAVIHMDFAENFSFVVQKEIQSSYWNQKQATLYTIVIDVGSDHRNMIIISNRMVHDTTFVYCAQRLIVKFIREEYSTIHKLNYVRYEMTFLFINVFLHIFYCLCSDGAPSQYKNNNNIMNLSLHKEDFGIDAVWTFTSSGHGKSSCDGLGAVVKTSARKYLLKKGPEAAFCSAKDFYQFTLEKTSQTKIATKSVCPRKSSNDTTGNENYDNSSDEENNVIITRPTRSIEVRWLDEQDVEETFQKVLKIRWRKLCTKGNAFISPTYPTFFTQLRSYCGYSKLS